MKEYKLDVFKFQVNWDEAQKRKQARAIGDGIFPVLRFLENHKIDPATVNSKAEIINKHFKDKFPFPNAPEATNFELLGIDPSPLENAHFLKDLNTDFFIDDNNQVKIRPEWHEANIEKHTSYTATEEENKAYEYTTKLIKMIVKGYEEGFLEKGYFETLTSENGLAYYSQSKKIIEYRGGPIKEAGRRHKKKQQNRKLVS